jgi:hypothetical protein
MARALLLNRRGQVEQNPAGGSGSAYADAVLSEPSLLSLWRLGEEAGVMEDQKGLHDLTVPYGPSSPTAGTRGVAGLLDGDPDKAWQAGDGNMIGVGPTTDYFFNGVAPFTVEFMMQLSALPNVNATLMRAVDTQSSSLWTFILRTPGTLRFNRLGGGNADIAGFAAGTRYHIGATYDGVNVRLYRNAVLGAGPVASGTRAHSDAGINENGLRVGPGPSSGINFTVKIDELAIYSDDLPLATIQEHHALAFGL